LQEKNIKKINELNQNFMQNAHYFYENNKNNTNISLIDLNKKFIVFMLNKEKQQQQQNNILQYEKIEKNGFKGGEVPFQVSEFEMNLKSKEEDFKNQIHKKIPPSPKFNDDTDIEEPIKSIDLDRLILERNKDIETIIPKPMKSSPEITVTKRIQISNEEISNNIPSIIDLSSYNNNNKKQVSWGDNNNILKKFKIKEQEEKKEQEEVMIKDYMKVIKEMQIKIKKLEDVVFVKMKRTVTI
jgi:hypothetical protein